MKRTLTLALPLFLMGTAMLPASSALAQKADHEEKLVRTVVEVKDGKVFVNGKEVAEIADADAPVVFKRSGEEISGHLWNVERGRGGRANGFVLRSDDDAEGFRIRSMPRAFGFSSDDGANFEVFADGNFEDVFEIERDVQRRTAKALAEIELEAPMMGLYSQRVVIGKEAVEADQRSRELARSIRRGNGDTAEMEAELNALLDQVFEEKQAAQQQRIDKLRQQLTELEQRLQQRKEDRDQIISKRRDELLGKDSRFDW